MITGNVFNNGVNAGTQAGNAITGGTFSRSHLALGPTITGNVVNNGLNLPGATQAGNAITGGLFLHF